MECPGSGRAASGHTLLAGRADCQPSAVEVSAKKAGFLTQKVRTETAFLRMTGANLALQSARAGKRKSRVLPASRSPQNLGQVFRHCIQSTYAKQRTQESLFTPDGSSTLYVVGVVLPAARRFAVGSSRTVCSTSCLPMSEYSGMETVGSLKQFVPLNGRASERQLQDSAYDAAIVSCDEARSFPDTRSR